MVGTFREKVRSIWLLESMFNVDGSVASVEEVIKWRKRYRL